MWYIPTDHDGSTHGLGFTVIGNLKSASYISMVYSACRCILLDICYLSVICDNRFRIRAHSLNCNPFGIQIFICIDFLNHELCRIICLSIFCNECSELTFESVNDWSQLIRRRFRCVATGFLESYRLLKLIFWVIRFKHLSLCLIALLRNLDSCLSVYKKLVLAFRIRINIHYLRLCLVRKAIIDFIFIWHLNFWVLYGCTAIINNLYGHLRIEYRRMRIHRQSHACHQHCHSQYDYE